jgi:hypothetical protein
VARSVTLVDCETCIRTVGNSRTTLFAVSRSFVCDARQEGIRASGTSAVEVDAFDDVVITSGEQGIHAEGNGEGVLAAQGTCSIDGFEPFRVEGTAVESRETEIPMLMM